MTRYYTSSALPTVLAASLGASGNPSVVSLPGTWPTSYPFCCLIDWGTSAQEAILVTSAPTGTGPYALPCTRGIDGTTQQAHNAGAQAEHGTTGYEPTLLQTLQSDVGTLAIEVPVPPGGTTEYYRADGTWDVPPGAAAAGTGLVLTGSTMSLSTPVSVADGGTNSTTQNWQSLLTPTTQTTTYTATAGQLVKANISSASWTLTLPNAPAANTVVGAKVSANATGNANTLTVACAGSDVFEQSGGATSTTLSLLSQAAAWQYNSGYWTRLSDDLPLGQLDARYTRFVNVVNYGADPTDTNDSTTAINAALTAVSASNAGATVFFPAGTYKVSGTLSANGSSGVTLLGCGGTTGGAGAGSSLRFSNTGSGALISANSTIGFRIRDMQIIYTSTSFTGNLVDLRNVSAGDTALFEVSGCLFAASSTASATACIALDKANSGTIEKCNFEGATYGILGRASGSSYSNANAVRGCQFVDIGTAGIRNPNQGWHIAGNTFENLAAGGAGGILCDSGAGTYGTEITGNWFGDATVNSGSPISINGGGFSITGNYIGYITGMTAVVIGASSVGFAIRANRFDPGGGSGTTAISLGSGCVSYDCSGNGLAALGLPDPVTDLIDTTAADIQPIGAQAAGSTGKAADAGHVHPAAVLGTNLITNPDFASGTTGWSAAVAGVSFLNSGATLTQNTSDSADGSGTCGQVVTTSSTFYEGARYVLTGLAASTEYLFSVYLKMTSGSQVVQLICWDDTNGIYGPFTSTPNPCPGTWTQYSTIITTGSTGSVAAVAAVRGDSSTVSTFLISDAYFGTYTAFPLLNTTAANIAPPGTAALAGTTGLAADGSHVHPWTTGAVLATSATTGFHYLPTCAGTPTGTPASMTGGAAAVFDTTNDKIWVYVGGAWKGAVVS